MARNDPQFNLRMTQELKCELTERAKRNGRSLNAEIVQILDDAIEAEKSGFPAGDARELRNVIRMQSEMLDQQGSNLKSMASMFAESLKKVSEIIEEKHNKKPT